MPLLLQVGCLKFTIYLNLISSCLKFTVDPEQAVAQNLQHIQIMLEVA